MKNTRQYWIVGYAIAIMVLGWGLVTWMDAYVSEPDTPIPFPAQTIKPQVKGQGYSLGRYAKLMDGSLFWGIYPVVTPPSTFHSSLTLWGTIKGSTAIVSLDPSSNQNSKLVKVGEEIGGEKILAIEKDYILVRNSTGEGKVKM
ncbi:MAG TPA: hypothetical protein VHY08_16980 [Bacillota bacterium]|nr:hypothetical protein [Bacillota bacterium]